MSDNLLNRHRIGIIAGSGPEAGLDLWNKVLDENRSCLGLKYRGDIDAPDVTIRSSPKLGYSMDLNEHFNELKDHFEKVALELASVVDYFGIACHTLHCFSNSIKELRLDAGFISISQVCIDHVSRKSLRKIGVLATSYTLNFKRYSFFSDLQNKCDLELPLDPEQVDDLIRRIKLVGANRDTRHRLLNIIEQFESEVLLLACTELPLLLPMKTPGHQFIDPTRLLAHELVKLSFAPTKESVWRA